MNAINFKVMSRMLNLLRLWDQQPERRPHLMVMYGAGDKAFSSGGDVKYSTIECKKDFMMWHRWYLSFHQDLYHLHLLKKPYHVAIWNGYVAGAGTGFSINAPIRIVTEKSSY